MRAGKRLHNGWLRHAAVALLFVVSAAPVRAIDNPDAPNRAAAFESRAAAFEERLNATDGGSAAALSGHAYAEFLDAELNTAYRTLLLKLQGPARSALVESQRQWLRFRAAENSFIAQHWTRERSGSSASLSSAGYRTALVKQRVLQLLRYGADY